MALPRGAVVPFQGPAQQDGWVWDGASWCQPQPCPPTPPPCPPGPAGCPPWYPPPANQSPWYPGANGGVTFSSTPPPCPVRGNFWYDGRVLWMFDGANWVDVGVAGISSLLGGAGGAPVFIGATAPPSPAPGSLWWDGTVLRLWDGVRWDLIGPTAPTTATGVLVGVTYLLVSQIVPIPALATRALVQMSGGSGGSGGCVDSASPGTGGGAYLEKLLIGLTPGNTMNFTFGAAGGGGAPGSPGGNGGPSLLTSGTQSIPTLIANGSNGGPAGQNSGSPDFSAVAQPGTPGGTASGGDLNIPGTAGGGSYLAQEDAFSLAGNGVWAPGAQGANSGSVAPPAGVNGNPGSPGAGKIMWFS